MLACGLLTALASAQNCASLTVTGTGAGGTPLDFTLVGAPDSLAVLAYGETTGTTTIQIGQLATLTLDLARPFIPIPIGITDSTGTASLNITVPNLPQTLNLNVQGLTATFALTPPTFGLTFCTSNVVAFSIG